MLLHCQIRICLSGHSKFDMDWNLFLQNYLPPPAPQQYNPPPK